MGDMTVVTSKVKALAKKSGLRTSGEFISRLDDLVKDAVKRAAEKAKEDKRGTLKERDLEPDAT